MIPVLVSFLTILRDSLRTQVALQAEILALRHQLLVLHRTPTREQLSKLDRKRTRKGSNADWVNPHDPEAGITKLKDGRTHLAYKAEHAVSICR